MFNIMKKNAEIKEQVLDDVTDEQLSQVTGGSLLSAVDLKGLVGTVTGLTGSTTNSISVSGVTVQAAGFSISTPTIAPGTLI